MEKQVIAAVDRVLEASGSYVPLELLLEEGRLGYSDYEAWRSGAHPTLEACLFGDPEEIGRLLEEAARYAEARGLVAVHRPYRNWADEGEGSLRFSHNPERDRTFHQHYLKAEDRPQLDLFLDTVGSALVNEVVDALGDRNAVQARSGVERLLDTDPGNLHLGALERLTEALESLPGAHRVEELERLWLDRLESELQPLAERTLGAAGRDYLALFWGRLAEAFRGRPFDPAEPRTHPSYPLMRTGAWREVRTSIEQGEGWGEPELVERHALACHRMGDQGALLKGWFQLCHIAPPRGEALAEQLGGEWSGVMESFMDAEPELAIGDFPAWLLIQRPPLRRHLPYSSEEVAALPGALSLMLAMGRLEDPAGTEMIELRRALCRASPPLFEHLMARESASGKAPAR